VHFDDRIVVHARCGDVRGARFSYDYALTRDGELVADGWTRHAVVDRTTMRPTRFPEWLAAAIAAAEG
jgi:acyl-CoA thioesterase FadM